MTTKTFSSASNAKRAAAAAGIPGGNIAIHKEDDGRFTFHDVNELAVTEAAARKPHAERRSRPGEAPHAARRRRRTLAAQAKGRRRTAEPKPAQGAQGEGREGAQGRVEAGSPDRPPEAPGGGQRHRAGGRVRLAAPHGARRGRGRPEAEAGHPGRGREGRSARRGGLPDHHHQQGGVTMEIDLHLLAGLRLPDRRHRGLEGPARHRLADPRRALRHLRPDRGLRDAAHRPA